MNMQQLGPGRRERSRRNSTECISRRLSQRSNHEEPIPGSV